MSLPELFNASPRKFDVPELESGEYENAFDEMELLGFPLCNPFQLMRFRTTALVRTRSLPLYLNRTVTMLGYLVAIKNTSTSNGKDMHFGTFLDEEGAFIDTVHFPPVADRFPFRGRGIYRITGKVVEEFGFYSLEVTSMHKELYIEDARYSDAERKYQRIRP